MTDRLGRAVRAVLELCDRADEARSRIAAALGPSGGES